MRVLQRVPRQLVVLRLALIAIASIFTISCTDNGLSEPDLTGATNAPDPTAAGSDSFMTEMAPVLSQMRALDWSRIPPRFAPVALDITPNTVSLAKGGTTTFYATVTLSNGARLRLPALWAATGGDITSGGRYTAGNRAGTFYVVGRMYPGLVDSSRVSIGNGDPEPEPEPGATLTKIELTPSSVSLQTGARRQFTATGKMSDGSSITITPVYLATGGNMSRAGEYTAGTSSGSYRVIAQSTDGKVADTAAVTITTATVRSLTLNPAQVTLAPGGRQQFTATGTMSDGSTSTVAADFSATGGTILGSGSYTAGSSVGNYRVIATDPQSGMADTASVKVEITVASISLSPASVTLETGETRQLTATAKDGSGDPVGGQSFTWSSSNTDVVKVSSSGLVTALSAGNATISATAAGKKGEASVVVSATEPPSPPPPPPPPPPTSSEGCPASGYDRLVNVSSTSQLQSAVQNAQPGDQIRMAAGTYVTRKFDITRSGTTSSPITLCGPRSAVLNGALAPTGARWWVFQGFRIRGDSPNRELWGVYQQDGGDNVYDNLEISHTSQEAFHLRGSASRNTLRNSYIHETGQVSGTIGECVYIGNGGTGADPANDNHIHHNRLEDCTAEGVDVKEGTNGNVVEFNQIKRVGLAGAVGSDAGIALRGNGAKVYDNTIDDTPRYSMQIWTTIATQGDNNVVRRNTFSGMGNGVGIQVGDGETGNVVGCDNRVTGGSLGVSCQ